MKFYGSAKTSSEKNEGAKPKPSELIYKSIEKIAKGKANRFSTGKPPRNLKDDFFYEALVKCLESVDKFDANKPSKNPFGYFTKIAKNSLKKSFKFWTS